MVLRLNQMSFGQARVRGYSRKDLQRAKNISIGVRKYYREFPRTISVDAPPLRRFRNMSVRSYYMRFPEEVERSEDYPRGWKTGHKLVAENRAWFSAEGKSSGSKRKKLNSLVMEQEQAIIKKLKRIVKKYPEGNQTGFYIEGEEKNVRVGRNDLRTFETLGKIAKKVKWFV